MHEFPELRCRIDSESGDRAKRSYCHQAPLRTCRRRWSIGPESAVSGEVQGLNSFLPQRLSRLGSPPDPAQKVADEAIGVLLAESPVFVLYSWDRPGHPSDSPLSIHGVLELPVKALAVLGKRSEIHPHAIDLGKGQICYCLVDTPQYQDDVKCFYSCCLERWPYEILTEKSFFILSKRQMNRSQ